MQTSSEKKFQSRFVSTVWRPSARWISGNPCSRDLHRRYSILERKTSQILASSQDCCLPDRLQTGPSLALPHKRKQKHCRRHNNFTVSVPVVVLCQEVHLENLKLSSPSSVEPPDSPLTGKCSLSSWPRFPVFRASV